MWRPGYLGDDSLPTDLVGDQGSPAAAWGSNMHWAKEGSSQASEPWISIVAPHRERLWPEDLGKHEVAFAYSCRTGEALTLEAEESVRDAWKRSFDTDWLVGTADWWGTLPGGEPWVDDLKTGWKRPELPLPQLTVEGLVKARLDRSDTARCSLTFWPRGQDTYPDRKWYRLTRKALDAFEKRLQVAWRRAMDSRTPVPGPHCQYCSSALVCPEGQGPKEVEEQVKEEKTNG